MFCSSYTSYFYTPEFLGFALHATSIVSMPFHILAFYCVIYKTPKRMESIKTCMLVLCVWNIVLDLILTVLVAPFVLFPMVAIRSLGFFEVVGVSMSIQSFIMMFTITGCVTALSSLFANRYNNVKPTGFKHQQHLIYLINLGTVLILDYLCAFSDIPDQNVALPLLFEKLPCIPQLHRSRSIFVITEHVQLVMISIVGMIILVTSQAICFVLAILYHLRTQPISTVSRRTQHMQKTFFFALALQIVIPIIVVAIPLLYLMYASFISHYNQASNNIMVLNLALHGTVSSISMVVIHKPYRQVVWWRKK